MSFLAFAIFVILILCVAWFYQWLKKVEGEIRAELADETDTAGDTPIPFAAEDKDEASSNFEEEGPEAASSPNEAVLEVIRAHPGIRQVDIYDRLPTMSKRRIQDIVRSLEKEGRVRRTPDRGSYLLETV